MILRSLSFLRLCVTASALAAVAAPATLSAQAVSGYKFLEAVKKREGDEVTKMLNMPGGTLINTRDIVSGESALHIVTQRRDLIWMNFVLEKGAKVDAIDNKGVTALLIATQLRFADGVTLLLNKGADVNKGDAQGQTPLIKAVLNRDLPMVRLLVARGANPDKSDSVTGLSARDQAKRDPRSAMILQAMTLAKPATTKPVMGPGIK